MYVQLAKEWTDRRGVRHPAGAYVDVDAGTLAELEADGTVKRPKAPSDGGGSDGGGPDGRGYQGPGDGWGGPATGSSPGGRPPGTDFDDDR